MDDLEINNVNISYSYPILSDEDKELCWTRPAAQSRGKFYLIQDNKIIGKMRMVSARVYPNGIHEQVAVAPDDDATREFFKDDYSICDVILTPHFRYDGITGRPMALYTDEPVNRHKGTEIVDEVDFDFGICHPRFKSVKGWAAVRNKPKPSVHTKHKHRRPRNSNKIKKVA